MFSDALLLKAAMVILAAEDALGQLSYGERSDLLQDQGVAGGSSGAHLILDRLLRDVVGEDGDGIPKGYTDEYINNGTEV
jgi:hypothetical protein